MNISTLVEFFNRKKRNDQKSIEMMLKNLDKENKELSLLFTKTNIINYEKINC